MFKGTIRFTDKYTLRCMDDATYTVGERYIDEDLNVEVYVKPNLEYPNVYWLTWSTGGTLLIQKKSMRSAFANGCIEIIQQGV